VETHTAPAALELRRREVLRQASVALAGRTVALWEVSPSAEVVAVMASAAAPRPADTRLDLETTLHRWSAPIIQGSRWVGCRLDDGDGGGPWCVAPVRQQPPAPPPDGVERRSRERMTLELAGLCVGLLDHPTPVTHPRRAEPDALLELSRQPSVIAHEVANPLTAALAALDLTRELVREADSVDPAFRATLLDELTGVSDGMEQAIQFLRSIQDRARGTLARSERFDAAQVVRSCVSLERPLARQRGVALQGVVALSDVFLQGDPNALYQVLTNLIRNAVAASLDAGHPVVVTLEHTGELLRLAVADRGAGIAAEHIERIFEPGFTTREFGSGSGTGLTVVTQITRDMFGGGVEVRSTVGQGTTFTVNLPIPPQRTPRRR
jgi:signal transduction histidine kinase